jgi:hypothetical protein
MEDPMPVHSLLVAVTAALCVPAPSDPVSIPNPTTELMVQVLPNAIEFRVEGPNEPFVGIVIGSLEGTLTHYLHTLPPLLTDFVVLDFGIGDVREGYRTVLAESLFPNGILVSVQGVTLAGGGIGASDVLEFVLDVTVPE